MEQEFESRSATVTASLFTLMGREYVALDGAGKVVVLPGDVFRALFRPKVADALLDEFKRRQARLLGIPVEQLDHDSAVTDFERLQSDKRRLAPADVLAPSGKAATRRRNAAVTEHATDLSMYPEAMRHPLAESQRTVWDALDVPRGMDDLQSKTGMTSPSLYSALSTMRNRCLVHKRDADGKWERTEEVSR